MKIINLPIYECKVKFHLLENKEEALKLYSKICKKHKIIEDEGEFYGMVIPTFDIYYMLIVKTNNWRNSFFHELFHVVDLIASDRDIHDSEAKAYLQGMIGDCLLKEIN